MLLLIEKKMKSHYEKAVRLLENNLQINLLLSKRFCIRQAIERSYKINNETNSGENKVDPYTEAFHDFFILYINYDKKLIKKYLKIN